MSMALLNIGAGMPRLGKDINILRPTFRIERCISFEIGIYFDEAPDVPELSAKF